ncbi:MAG: hypothetical protein NVV63_02625 [Opitutus sp.]|nr:hypothetical protein [Opitutus sp.]
MKLATPLLSALLFLFGLSIRADAQDATFSLDTVTVWSAGVYVSDEPVYYYGTEEGQALFAPITLAGSLHSNNQQDGYGVDLAWNASGNELEVTGSHRIASPILGPLNYHIGASNLSFSFTLEEESLVHLEWSFIALTEFSSLNWSTTGYGIEIGGIEYTDPINTTLRLEAGTYTGVIAALLYADYFDGDRQESASLDYTARLSVTAIPEPMHYTLSFGAVAGLIVICRRMTRTSRQ